MTEEAWLDIGLVLAAGAGRRFGRPKATVIVAGERLVDRAVRVLRQGGCHQVVVVLGAWLGGVASAHTTHNPEWRQGMGSSLRWGLMQLNTLPRASHAPPRRAVITLVDLPGLTPLAVATLRQSMAGLAAASYGGQQGHPVLIGEDHWPSLTEQLHGDCGARDFLRAHQALLIPLDALADGSDLDTPQSALPKSAVRPSLESW